VVAVAAACSSGGGGAPAGTSSTSANQTNIKVAPLKTGGSITVLESSGYSGAWPYGLDPLTNVDAVANQDFSEAIFGQLFMLGPNGKVEPDLATGYSYGPNAKTVTITLRQGVTFSNGDPFNAQAVLAYWNTLLGPIGVKAGTAPPWEIARVNPKVPTSAPAPGAIVATGPYTIVIHQIVPNAAFINQLFDGLATWIPDMKAYTKEGAAQFARYPIGAGPFTVVSDNYNNELVVKKNPHYWQAGHPYLDQITFKVVGSDESAYEAMLAGQGQVYEDLGTTAIINEAQKQFQVYDMPGTSPYDLQLNTVNAPFNNIKARQAIYAATNFAPILAHIFGNRYPTTESFTGPGGLCYMPTVPGYQGYNPTLAKKLVQESGLNKVTFTLGTISSYAVAVQTTEALRTEWEAVGMHVNIASYTLNNLVAAFLANGGKTWQSMVQTAGAFDPASGVGVGFRFLSTSPISGVHSKTLDTLLNEAASYTNVAKRCSYYKQAAEYIAKNYDGPFYFVVNPTTLSAKGVGGPGITSALPAVVVTPTIPWEDVWYNPSYSS
jgi:peptide/nickel transport system substrate-binding protein